MLTGSLEPTNEAYALAKICGIKLCQAYARQYGANFISAMPTNLYGPEDNFDLKTSHVLPALIHKFHLAKEKGRTERHALGHRQRLPRISPRRRSRRGLPFPDGKLRFARADQRRLLATDITIRDWPSWSARVVGFPGKIEWDTTKPDGTPRKLLDVSRLAMAWVEGPRFLWKKGLRATYQWWLEHGRN